MRHLTYVSISCGLLLAAATVAVAATPAQQALYSKQVAAAKAADAAFVPSSERGKAFFLGRHTGGKVDSPSCTSCHTSNLGKVGQTRAGKAIEPMAASISTSRYTDPAHVEKWFKRNCMDVLGRECSAGEKADALAFLLSL